jgi:hypothetical protein
MWGFPPTLWRWVDPPDPDAGVRAPITLLRSAAFAAIVTAVICLGAGGAEIWRFSLMLRGRTDVLSGTDVRISDALVLAASWAALICASATAAIMVPAIVRAHRAAAVRAGLPCPVCGDTVAEVSFADRSFQYCPTCQTGGKKLADRRMSRLLR